MAYEWRNWLDLAAGHLTNAQVALNNGGYYVTAMCWASRPPNRV